MLSLRLARFSLIVEWFTSVAEMFGSHLSATNLPIFYFQATREFWRGFGGVTKGSLWFLRDVSGMFQTHSRVFQELSVGFRREFRRIQGRFRRLTGKSLVVSRNFRVSGDIKYISPGTTLRPLETP